VDSYDAKGQGSALVLVVMYEACQAEVKLPSQPQPPTFMLMPLLTQLSQFNQYYCDWHGVVSRDCKPAEICDFGVKFGQ